MKQFENDMDDLFNKAGQDYPLNTGKKDWDAVNKALQSEQAPIANKKTINRYLRYLPLMLLLMVPVVFLFNANLKDNSNIPTKEQIVRENQPSVKPENDKPSRESSTGQRSTEEISSVKPGTKSAEVNQSDIEGNTRKTTDTKQDMAAERMAANTPGSEPKGTTTVVPGLSTSQIERKGNDNRRENIQDQKRNTSENNKKARAPYLTDYEKSTKEMVIGRPDDTEDETWSGRMRAPLLSAISPTVNAPALTIDGNPRQSRVPGDVLPSQEKRSPGQQKHARFYYGVKGGLDLSSIRNQRIDRAGYAAGILAGFQFSSRWSLEISGLWSSKEYYTDGKYFDKTRAYMPSTVYIHSLDGGCNMIEVPVAIRYRFSPSGNTFFATAGLNSYFMNKEEYEYKADAGSGTYEGYRTYNNSGNFFLSNLQLSGGYQFTLFKNTNIRLEPYLQLPLRHIGIGRMPITSAGVHLGLFRDIR